MSEHDDPLTPAAKRATSGKDKTVSCESFKEDVAECRAIKSNKPKLAQCVYQIETIELPVVRLKHGLGFNAGCTGNVKQPLPQ